MTGAAELEIWWWWRCMPHFSIAFYAPQVDACAMRHFDTIAATWLIGRCRAIISLRLPPLNHEFFRKFSWLSCFARAITFFRWRERYVDDGKFLSAIIIKVSRISSYFDIVISVFSLRYRTWVRIISPCSHQLSFISMIIQTLIITLPLMLLFACALLRKITLKAMLDE